MPKLFQRRVIGAAAMVLALGCCAAARGESLLPLDSETATMLPKGEAEAILGASYYEDLRFPPFTAAGALRDHHLTRAPQFAFRAAAGNWAEIQASFEVVTIDEITRSGESRTNTGAGDARIFTKVRVVREERKVPGLALRFGTKLPNANAKNRLGTDEADFQLHGLVSKDFGPLSAHLNLGLVLLGNPGPVLGAPDRSASGQDDLFGYSAAVVSRPIGLPGAKAYLLRFFSEVDGLANSRFDNNRSAVRCGIQVRRRALTLYAGGSLGLTAGSENFGALGGLIYTMELDRLLGTVE